MNLVKLDWQFVFTIINILVLYLLMKKFLFKPVTEFMQKRADGIKQELGEAKKKMDDAEELNKKYLELLEAAQIKADEIVNQAKNKAAEEYERIMEEAKSEANSMLLRAKELIENERRSAIQSAKSEISGLAFSVASKLIKKNIDNDANRKLIEDFLKEEGVA